MPRPVKVRSLTNYQTLVTTATHAVMLDEHGDQGEDLGPTPQELMIGALAGCISITLFLYAKRKEWPLESVEVDSELDRPEGPGGPFRIKADVRLKGPLDAEQVQRLSEIAGRCPVHRMLTESTRVEKRVKLVAQV